MTTPIDRRLLDAGLTITIADLITVWADHRPAHTPVPDTCPGCGHNYITSGPLCPTAAMAHPLLQRRRHQTTPARLLKALTFNQYADLLGKHLTTETAFLAQRAHHLAEQTTTAATVCDQQSLFDLTPAIRRTGGAR